MNTEHRFLITYGLHHFVSHSHKDGKGTFTIRNHDNAKMVSHAKGLITGKYGQAAHIQMV